MWRWIVAGLRRGAPFGVYLLFYLVICLLWILLKDHVEPPTSGLLNWLTFAGGIAAIIAAWRLSLSFSFDPNYSEGSTGYIEIPPVNANRPLTENIANHARQLRLLALTYERHRQTLTRVGVTIAVASLAVPVATWLVILLDAFSKKESMPNAWLLVVSSTTTGALGLAISVTLLRHLKNNQRPHAEVSHRMLICIETNIALSSSDLTPEGRSSALSLAMNSLVRPPTLAVTSESDVASDAEGEKSLLSLLTSALKPRSGE